MTETRPADHGDEVEGAPAPDGSSEAVGCFKRDLLYCVKRDLLYWTSEAVGCAERPAGAVLFSQRGIFSCFV